MTYKQKPYFQLWSKIIDGLTKRDLNVENKIAIWSAASSQLQHRICTGTVTNFLYLSQITVFKFITDYRVFSCKKLFTETRQAAFDLFAIKRIPFSLGRRILTLACRMWRPRQLNCLISSKVIDTGPGQGLASPQKRILIHYQTQGLQEDVCFMKNNLC